MGPPMNKVVGRAGPLIVDDSIDVRTFEDVRRFGGPVLVFQFPRALCLEGWRAELARSGWSGFV